MLGQGHVPGQIVNTNRHIVPLFVLTFSTQSVLSPWCCLVSTVPGLEALSDQPIVQSLSNGSVFWYPPFSYLARAGIDTGNVDSRDELNGRRVIGVVRSTVNVHTVYPVLMNALKDGKLVMVSWWRGVESLTNVGRTKNSSIPVAHHHVLPIGKSI